MPLAHSPCYAPPRGLLTPWGVAPHPTFATWQGCRENLLHPYHGALGRLQPVKAKPQAVASQALTGFQLRLLRIVLLPPRRWRGQGRRSRAFLPLTPWSRPNTHRRGRWIGFATCPCGLASEWGLGQSPKVLFFVFDVVRVNVTVQKGQKNVHFRIFATKNTANLANF